MADDGRGNFGNTEEHQKAGSMSSGNPNPQNNLSQEDKSKGGKSAHNQDSTQSDTNLNEGTDMGSDIE